MRTQTAAYVLAGALAVMACAAEAPAPPEVAPAPEASVAPAGQAFEPAVSINRVMVDLVNDHATQIWDVDLNPPETDQDWIELRHAATALTAAGSITAVGGSADGDMEWANQADWVRMSQAMTDMGARALTAAERRNLDQLLAVGDDLVTTCINCHNVYRLDVPAIWSERAQEIPGQ